jgi:AcrR family transcriptional regulator
MQSLPMMTCTPYSCQVTSSEQPDSAASPGHDEGGERARLTRSAVVDRALQFADAEGLDALTIRKLAQLLGVTPMALYWHFRSKDELIDGLAERVWSEIDVNIDEATPWPAQLRSLLESLLRMLRAHPAAAQLLLQTEKQNPSKLRAIEVTLELLRNAGFDPRHASEIAHGALWTGIMLVMSEPGVTVLAPEERVEMQRRKQVVLATLPSATFPRLVECAIPMTACDDPDFHYELGASVFIAGVEAIAKRFGKPELATSWTAGSRGAGRRR